MLQKNDKPDLFEKLVYASGQVGLNAMCTLFASYVLLFYTDVIGVNAATVGTIVLISKLFDGFSDIIAGQLIDKHKSKYGHCIPVIMRWTIPMTLSVIFVFMAPKTVGMLQLVFIFVTYNLFNTIFYTYVSMAYTSLPTYCTDDPVDRSQMCVYTMLVAAAMQTILASTIMPMVNFFGGQDQQSAWIKSIAVFGALGVVFLYLNVLFVKERVDNNAPAENIFVGLKCAVQNKYWVYTLLANICNNAILVFNLSVSVYYLGNVAGNLGLMGAYVGCSNIPGVIVMMFTPAILRKISKRSLAVCGSLMMLVGQILFVLGPSNSVPWLLGTALFRGIGFGFTMGLNGAMVADCIDYGEWKTGTRVQSVLFSSNSVGVKVGSGLLTSGLGFFLTAVGYDGLKQVQDTATITGIDNFFRFVPIIIFVLLLLFSWLFDLEKKLPEIQKELVERRGPIEHVG